MAKTPKQQLALDYAKQYLDKILDLVTYVDERVQWRVGDMMGRNPQAPPSGGESAAGGKSR